MAALHVFYHLADIHIKDDRRDEYRAVYDTLFYELRARARAHVHATIYAVIAGDIFDTKTKISSNNITDFYYLINGLLSACDYVITMFGNHDINLNNPASVDLVSPLAFEHHDINNRLIHCDDTGSYYINGLCFNIKSPADPSEVYPLDARHACNLLILHENVDGVKHNGFKLSGRIKQSIFDEYTMVMCGHIHEYIPIKGNGAYSGALIQQTIGETYTKGIVEWTYDARANTVTRQFIQIPNQYKYIKIQIGASFMHINKDTTIPTDETRVSAAALVSEFEACAARGDVVPKVVVHVHDADAAAVIEQVRAHLKVEPTVHYMQTDASAGATRREQLLQRQEQSNLIARHLEQNKIADDVRQAVIKLHEDGFVARDMRTKHTWSLLSLEWSNLFCYTENNMIEFAADTESIIYGIIADNKCGKSSVIDILILMLFNRLLRGDMKNIVNKSKSVASARIVFRHDGRAHSVARTFAPDRQKCSILYTIDGVNQTEDTVDAMYARLSTIVGSYDDFVCINTLTQGRNRDFLYLSNQERLEFLKYLFGIDVFEQRLACAKDQLKEILTTIKCLRAHPEEPRSLSDIAHDLARTTQSRDQVSRDLAAAEMQAHTLKDFIPHKPQHSILEIKARIAAHSNELQTLNDAAAMCQDMDLNLLNERKISLLASISETKRIKSNYKNNSQEINAAAKKITEDEVLNKMRQLQMLRDARATLEIELRGLNVRAHEMADADDKVCMQSTADDAHDIQAVLQQKHKIEYEIRCGARFDRYVCMLSSCSKADAQWDCDVHAQIAAQFKVPPPRLLYVAADLSDLNRFDSIKSEQCALINEQMELYNEEAACARKQKDLLTCVLNHLIKYHQYADINALRHDAETWNKIVELRARLQPARPHDEIVHAINGRASAKVTSEIVSLKQAMLATNTTYKKLVSKIQYNADCAQCMHNQKAIARIQSKSMVENIEKQIENKLAEKRELIRLETELQTSAANAALTSEIHQLTAFLKYPRAERVDIQYAIDHHDDIMKNAAACSELDRMNHELNAKRRRLDEMKIELDSIKTKLDALEYARLCAQLKCPNVSAADMNVMHTMYDEIKRLAAARIELDDINRRITCLTRSKIKQMRGIEHEINDLERALYAHYCNELNEVECAIKYIHARTNLESSMLELTRAQLEYDEYINALNKHEQYKSSLELINKCKSELISLDAAIAALSLEQESARKYEALSREAMVLSEYIKTIDCKTGIPVRILNQSCEHVTAAANGVLSELCDFKLKLSVEARQKTSTVRLTLTAASSELPADMGSGFQLFVTSIALRIAFSKVMCGAVSDMLIIDEGFACLDDKNLNKIIQVLPALKAMYSKLLVISHLDVIKAAIERPIFIINNRIANEGSVNDAPPPQIASFICAACKYETTSSARFAKHEQSATHKKRMNKK